MSTGLVHGLNWVVRQGTYSQSSLFLDGQASRLRNWGQMLLALESVESLRAYELTHASSDLNPVLAHPSFISGLAMASTRTDLALRALFAV